MKAIFEYIKSDNATKRRLVPVKFMNGMLLFRQYSTEYQDAIPNKLLKELHLPNVERHGPYIKVPASHIPHFYKKCYALGGTLVYDGPKGEIPLFKDQLTLCQVGRT